MSSWPLSVWFFWLEQGQRKRLHNSSLSGNLGKQYLCKVDIYVNMLEEMHCWSYFYCPDMRAQTSSLSLAVQILQYLTGRKKNHDIPLLYCTDFSFFPLHWAWKKWVIELCILPILLNALHLGQRKTIHLV